MYEFFICLFIYLFSLSTLNNKKVFLNCEAVSSTVVLAYNVESKVADCQPAHYFDKENASPQMKDSLIAHEGEPALQKIKNFPVGGYSMKGLGGTSIARRSGWKFPAGTSNRVICYLQPKHIVMASKGQNDLDKKWLGCSNTKFRTKKEMIHTIAEAHKSFHVHGVRFEQKIVIFGRANFTKKKFHESCPRNMDEYSQMAQFDIPGGENEEIASVGEWRELGFFVLWWWSI